MTQRFTRIAALAGAIGLLGFYIAFGILSYKQPLVADDLSLLESIEKHPGAAAFVWSQYTGWTARPPVTLPAYYALQHRTFEATVNALVLSGIVLLAFRAGRARWPRAEPADVGLLAALTGAMWFGMPAPGESMLWVTGTVTYLWQCLPLVALLSAYALRWPTNDEGAVAPRLAFVVAIGALAAVVGLASLQTASASGIFLLAWLVAWLRRHPRTRPPRLWWAGSAGLMFGLALQLLSPGNAARMGIGSASGSPADFLPWLAEVYGTNLKMLLVWCAFGASIVAADRIASGARVALSSRSVAWVLASLGALLPFVALMAYAVPRSQAFTVVLLASAAASAVRTRPAPSSRPSGGALLAMTAVALLLVAIPLRDVVLEVRQADVVLDAMDARDAIIEAARDAGVRHVRVEPLAVRPRRALYIREFAVDPEFWSNQVAARRYGIESIATTTAPEAITTVP